MKNPHNHVRRRWDAAVGALCVAMALHGVGNAQGAVAAGDECGALEMQRQVALKEGSLDRLEAVAERYVSLCRSKRSKPELALAMEEVAYVKRRAGRPLESLNKAQWCLNFEYQAVGCHAAKALALMDMKMPNEAREVVKTGFDMASKVETLATHELEIAERKRSTVKEDDYNSRMRSARWRLGVAAAGRQSLREVEAALGKMKR